MIIHMPQRNPFPVALIAVVLLPPFAVEAGTPEQSEKVRALLRRHCLRCHGEKPRGGVRLLELPQQDAHGRRLVVPRVPEGSLLFDLVAGGSMPPGRLPKVSADEVALLRDWIKDGAAIPSEAGQDYLLRLLVADLGRVPRESQPHVRYLSLNHLDPDRSAQQVGALRAVLGHLSAAEKPSPPVTVGPANGLLRIDLRDLGWDRKAFEGQPLKLFDLLLLEYPYGVLPHTPLPAGLAEFLRQTGQVRPIPYVRADWLVRAVLTEPVHGDFLTLLKAKGGAAPKLPPAQAVSFTEARRELEVDVAEDRFRAVLEAIAELAPLGGKATVARPAWERHFPHVVRRLGIGTPILPIDGETWDECSLDPSLRVDFRLVDPEDPGLPDEPAHKKRFVARRDKIQIWIRSNQDVELELIATDFTGQKRHLGREESTIVLRANKPQRPGKPILASSPGRRSLTLYAYPKKSLAGVHYPVGTLMNREGMRGRFVHRLYQPDASRGAKEDDRFDPAKMVKITLPFTVEKE
jgi:hypothetical protein